MKTKDLHAMSLPDLEKQLKTSREELFNLRFQMATGQLENHRQIRHVRRDLAQILTEIYQKRLAAPAGGDTPAETPQPARGVAAQTSPPGKRPRRAKAETA